MDKKNWFRTKILGVKVDFVNLEQAVEWVENQVKYNKKGQIVTPNPEQVVLAQKDKEFKHVLNDANLAICDGIGLILAARFLLFRSPAKILISLSESNSRKKSLSPMGGIGARIDKAHKILQTRFTKISGTDLMLALCRKAAQKGWRVFLLGGREGVASRAAAKLQITNYKLQITSFQGAKNIKEESESERKETIRKINHFHPHLLFVAYGAPYQEKWIAVNLPKLKVNIAMGVGGAFDYITGRVRRAPGWVRTLGLEWLWRLLAQPWRIKRQLRLLKFAFLVFRDFLKGNLCKISSLPKISKFSF